jgi:hypothetical protein
VVWPQNHWDGFSWFGLKPGGNSFSWFILKTGGDSFLLFGLKIGGDGFSFGLKTGGGGFSGLGLKTGNYGLVIWASKSPRLFLGLGLKTTQATVYRLCYKTDRRMMLAWDTRRDLASCFAWKQVSLGFSSLASILAEARRRVVHMAPS